MKKRIIILFIIFFTAVPSFAILQNTKSLVFYSCTENISTLIGVAAQASSNIQVDELQRPSSNAATAAPRRQPNVDIPRSVIDNVEIDDRTKNTSLFLETHVSATKTLKINLDLMQSYNYFDLQSRYYKYKMTNTLMLFYLATGLTKNLEIRIDLQAIFYNYFDVEGDNSGEPNSFKSAFYNPAFSIKWKVLNKINHGFNFTLLFGFQPDRGELGFGGSIYDNFNVSNMNLIKLGLYFSFPTFKITPYLDIDFSIGFRKDTGTTLFSVGVKDENYGLSSGEKTVYILNAKAGFEVRFTKWLIFHFYTRFSLNSDLVFNYFNMSMNNKTFFRVGPGVAFHFMLAKSTAISLLFTYFFSSNYKQKIEFYSGSPPPSTDVYDLKAGFNVIISVRTYIDFLNL